MFGTATLIIAISAFATLLPTVSMACAALTCLRGFALENADFTIFWMAKYLICNERRLRFWPKTAVVKTYRIPKRG
jgi:hypothetical protein